jgi:vacuolar protein sorting-associated protein 35
MDTAVSVELFVEILNRYVYYFDQGNETVSTIDLPSSKQHTPRLKSQIQFNLYVLEYRLTSNQVTTKYLNGLIELIHSNLSTSAAETNNAPQTQSMESPKKHFYRTLEYIKSREFEGVITEART